MGDRIDTGSTVPIRPLNELRDSGILWLINKSVFHPRGFALALDVDETTGNVTGWKILGNGHEVWSYQQHNDDDGFARAEATLKALTKKDN
jgi:hypothetical protein